MVQLDKDWDIKKRIFDGVKLAMELETALNNVFGNNSKINALAALAIGTSIKKRQKNVLRKVRNDIDTFIENK